MNCPYLARSQTLNSKRLRQPRWVRVLRSQGSRPGPTSAAPTGATEPNADL